MKNITQWVIILLLFLVGLIVIWYTLFSQFKVSFFNIMRNRHHRIVVFDLDETLGCFVEVGMFWDALEHFYKEHLPSKQLTDTDFFHVMDTFPEFLRPNIIPILEYLVDKKEQKQCDQIMIYTNNQGPKSWTVKISDYLSHKMGKPVFDQIIACFMRNGKVVEVGRTTDDKTVKDLIRCTNVPSDTEICFLDDRFHPLMKHDKVFYINVKPYNHSMSFEDMAKNYYKKNMSAYASKADASKADASEADASKADASGADVNEATFTSFIVSFMQRYNYTVTDKSALEADVDKVVSKRIMGYLEDFFKTNHKLLKTRKNRPGTQRKTRRH